VTEDVRSFGERLAEGRRYWIPYLRARAVLASFHDQSHQAIEYLREALALAEEISLPGEQWRIEVALAEMRRAAGDTVGARAAGERATAIIRALAADLSDERTRARFLEAALTRVRVVAPA
jgi:hypothetical protein